ncbi:hypothetical protein K443DRAFT_84678, partial [Laccaria amethystina LaAM-08-1]
EACTSVFWRYSAFSVWACLSLLLCSVKGQKRQQVCIPTFQRYSTFSGLVGRYLRFEQPRQDTFTSGEEQYESADEGSSPPASQTPVTGSLTPVPTTSRHRITGLTSGKPLLSWDKHVCKLFPRLSQGITGCPGAT